MDNHTHEFTVAVFGTAGCGKTTWLDRLTGQSFSSEYVPTLETKVITIDQLTTQGLIRYHLREIGGQTKFNAISPDYRADIGLAMFDASRVTSFKVGVEEFQAVNTGPVVYCGNKEELLTDTRITQFKMKAAGERLIYMSAKTLYHIEKPLLKIGRLLLNDPDLEHRVTQRSSSPIIRE